MSVSPIRPAAGRSAGQVRHPIGPAEPPPPPRPRGDVIEGRSPTALDAQRRGALLSALLAQLPRAERPAARTAIPAILDAARADGTHDPNRIAYLLATAQTESDFGAHMIESGHSPAWFDRAYGGVDGNRPGTSDGYTFRGRGYVQLTRAGRYAEISHRLGLPDVPTPHQLGASHPPTSLPALVAHPDALTEPRLAARVLVLGVTKNFFTHNPAAALDKTIPIGKPPGQVDFYHARGLVNGIVAAQARSLAAHATTYAQILAGYRHSVLGSPVTR